METTTQVNHKENNRGHRYLIVGTVRTGEYRTAYRTTAQGAEDTAEGFTHDWGYTQVTIHPPIDTPVDTDQVRADLSAARTALADQMQQAEAAALRLLEAGTSESEAARLLGVDRMTIRKWSGKS